MRSIALLVVMTVPAIASAQVTDQHDRFTGKPDVAYSAPMPEIGKPRVAVNVETANGVQKPSLALMVASLSDRRAASSWKYLRCHTVNWLADGSPLPVAPATHDGQVARGGVIEIIMQFPTMDQLRTIGGSSVVEYRICNDEYRLTPADIAGIREVVQRATGEVVTPAQPSEQQPAMKYRPRL